MPTIPPQDHNTYQQWLYLEPDGELDRSQRSELERHLVGCAACRQERREIASLGALLAEATVEADPGLASRVVANLPAAGWETRRPHSWIWAAAVFVLAAAGAALVGWSGGGLATVSPLTGTARAVVDLLATSAVAGAGLLTASWQGLGLALGEVFGGSKVTLVVFAVLVLGVDFLFVRYLLRRPSRALAEAGRGRKS